MIQIAFDSNVLVYIAGFDHHPGDAAKVTRAQDLAVELQTRALLVAPSQTLGELFTVLVRGRVTLEESRDAVTRVSETFDIAECGTKTMISAVDLAVAHKLRIWDALIVSASVDAGCTLLLSEDMQDGFSWRGLTIVNPFAEPLNGKLLEILAG